jgi:hypothetical protein
LADALLYRRVMRVLDTGIQAHSSIMGVNSVAFGDRMRGSGPRMTWLRHGRDLSGAVAMRAFR